MIVENNSGLIALYAEGTNKITNSERTFFSDLVYLGNQDSVDNYFEVSRDIWKNYIDEGTISDSQAIQERLGELEQENVGMLSTTFFLDFRVFDLECTVEEITSPTSRLATLSKRKTTGMTPYEMAKKLILLKEYNRVEMEYVLGRYLDRQVVLKDEYDELMLLMASYA